MPKTIMIVDDEEWVRDLVAATLEGREEYEVVQAANGKEALESIPRRSPDLILLDVMMPEVDGIEVCRRVKQDPETTHIKIIMLTARVSEMDRRLGLEAGADDYFSKPFSPTELLRKVDQLMQPEG